MSKIKFMKRVAIFALVIVTALTLAACGSSTKSPSGSLSDKDEYLTAGDYKVSKLELYNYMKQQGTNTLVQMISDALLQEQLNQVTASAFTGTSDQAKKLNKILDDLVNTSLFSSTDVEDIDDIDASDKTLTIKKFADSLYLVNNNINIDALTASLLEIVEKTDDTRYTGYAAIPAILEQYRGSVARHLFAETKLDADIAEEDGTYEITDAKILSYYQSNIQNRGDVELFHFYFINQNEATAAFRALNLKVNSSGEWFRIPDITDAAVRANILSDTIDERYIYVKSLLVDNKLLSAYEDETSFNNTFVNKNAENYKKFYQAYVVNTNRTDSPDFVLSAENVKQAFVELYNLVNITASNQSQKLAVNADGKIVYDESQELFETTVTYDDLTKLQTTFRSYVYNTLASEALIEADDTITKKASSTLRSIGTLRYLAYKFSSEEDDALDIIYTATDSGEEKDRFYKEDDEALNDFTAEEKQAILAEITRVTTEAKAKLKEDTLTSDYITSKVSAALKEADVQIYDTVLRLFYQQSYDYSGTKKQRSGDVVARINDTDIKVDDLYAKLELSYGINLATDLIVNKALLNNSNYTISAEDKALYQKELSTLITNFSQNAYESAGYPSSMGRAAFLLMAFGAETNDEALENAYILPELRKRYIADLEFQYGTDVYNKLAYLSALQYNEYQSLNVSHLLVYFDENADGTPDDPEEYLVSLTPEERTLVEEKIIELITLIYTKVGFKSSLSTGLNALATSFNEAGRIPLGTDGAEEDFTELRRHGFNLKYESISSTITNVSNSKTSSNTSILDKVFYERALELYEKLKAHYVNEDSDLSLPYLDFYGGNITVPTEVLTIEALEKVKSSFGYHFMLVTTFNEQKTAKYEMADDATEYTFEQDGKKYSAANDKDTISASQIEYYIKDQKFSTDDDEETESQGLPTSVSTAFGLYYTPLSTRLSADNTYYQRELFFLLLTKQGSITANLQTRFDAVRAINRRQYDNYLIGGDDENYNALYRDWFAILDGTKPIV